MLAATFDVPFRRRKSGAAGTRLCKGILMALDFAAALAAHAFELLFIEGLGWDRFQARLTVSHGGATFELAGIARKCGLVAFLCPAHRTVLANRGLLRGVQRRLRKSYHEHILIHACETPRKQVWQWATLLRGAHHVQHREHPFFSHEPPPRMLDRIRGLAIPLEDEGRTSLPGILDRVRQALQPEGERNLFARFPSYAAKSDCMAMAIKQGEDGALAAFVEFHMPLARRFSRRMRHWFGMDSEDAEQTAMIGLIEAARRFDPERGCQFSTFALHWIRNACQRYGLEWGLPMHVPVHYFWACYRLAFVETELVAAHGKAGSREPFERAIEDAGVTKGQWEHFLLARHFTRFSELDKSERWKIDRPEVPTEADDGKTLRELIGEALRKLRPRQAEILRMRYGFDQPEHSLQEVGDKLGVTKERIRQIQKSAEQKLVGLLHQPDMQDDLEQLDIFAHEEKE